MDDEDVKQTITSFEGMADFKGLSDWNQIKEITLQYFEDMTKDLCEEEMLVLFDHLISEEANHTNACPSNTFAYYSKLWYLESLKAKETETLTPEQNFRNEYKRKLIYKIGTNAFIPLFCEGYDSPIAHEIMNLMYQHLRNGELKAEAEKNGFGDKFIHIIVEETEKITEKYCHASLQECIEFYNFPDKKVLTRDRCPNCGSRHVLDNYEFGLECMDCSYTWFAPFGKRLYL
jgi:ribosomal protein S27AE